VFEELGVKEAVFKQLDAVMKPGAILASNTSTLDVDKIAAFTKRRRTWWACTSSAPPT
jgi:3-hydroxyacyl-CoA dehydrogenase